MNPRVLTILALASARLGFTGLASNKAAKGQIRDAFYDLLYSFRWGDAGLNNYGFAPADTHGEERFQLQLYRELVNLLNTSDGLPGDGRLLEVSCGRGGGLSHVTDLIPGPSQAIGLDFSFNAIRHCTRSCRNRPNVAFVCGSALQLPFADRSFDVVINVEASHAYRNDAAFLAEIGRVLASGGRFLYSDYRRRSHFCALQQLARDAGFTGNFHDITAHVVAACELDAGRRQALMRAGVPWYYRVLAKRQLMGYAAIPGTPNFERFRSGDRIYFNTCLTRI